VLSKLLCALLKVKPGTVVLQCCCMNQLVHFTKLVVLHMVYMHACTWHSVPA
jgi:hypothetical protein